MLASGGDPLQLTSDSTDKGLDGFSPDGTQVYYDVSAGNFASWAIPTLGGTPTRIAPGLGLASSPDGKWFYYGNQLSLLRKPNPGLVKKSFTSQTWDWFLSVFCLFRITGGY
jgi:hypothetical protein